jgi:hypothetical protein
MKPIYSPSSSDCSSRNCTGEVEYIQRTARKEKGTSTHLDEWLGRVEELRFALGLCTLLSPVENSLVANDVFIVEHLENIGKCLRQTSVFMAVYLNRIDQG